MTNYLLPIFWILLSAQPLWAVVCVKVLTPEEQNQTAIESRQFGTKRDFRDYTNTFGGPLRARIGRLGPEDLIVDLGAGDAIFGKEYLTLENFNGLDLPPTSKRARYLAVGADAPELIRPDLEAKLAQVKRERGDGVYREIVEWFDKIPDANLRGGSIYLSRFGVMTYVVDFQAALARILNIMEPGADLMITLHDGNLILRNKDGNSPEAWGLSWETKLTWLANIKGAELIYSVDSHEPVIVLRRTAGPVELPPSTTTKFTPAKLIPGYGVTGPSREVYFPIGDIDQSLPPPVQRLVDAAKAANTEAYTNWLKEVGKIWDQHETAYVRNPSDRLIVLLRGAAMTYYHEASLYRMAAQALAQAGRIELSRYYLALASTADFRGNDLIMKADLP